MLLILSTAQQLMELIFMLMIQLPYVYKLVPKVQILGAKILLGNARILVAQDLSIMIQEFVLIFALLV